MERILAMVWSRFFAIEIEGARTRWQHLRFHSSRLWADGRWASRAFGRT
jgi:hypothetical protein